MEEWLNGWMNDCMNEWLDEWMNDWINEWVNEGTSEYMNERLHEWMIGWMNEWMNDWMNEWTIAYLDRRLFYRALVAGEVVLISSIIKALLCFRAQADCMSKWLDEFKISRNREFQKSRNLDSIFQEIENPRN